MLNIPLRTMPGRAESAERRDARLQALMLLTGLQDTPIPEALKLLEMQRYAKSHGFAATIEPCGMPGRWFRGRPCLALVIPWSHCDDMGQLLATGERVFMARTFRGLRAILGY